MPEYAPSPFDAVRDQVALYEATDGEQGGTLEGRPVVILSTLGAKTGRIRKTPLLKIEHNGSYAVVASYGGAPVHPAWYHNVLAHPEVDLRDGATIRRLRAREVSGAEKDGVWRIADAIWPDFPGYRAAAAPRDIPVLLLEPTT